MDYYVFFFFASSLSFVSVVSETILVVGYKLLVFSQFDFVLTL